MFLRPFFRNMDNITNFETALRQFAGSMVCERIYKIHKQDVASNS